MRSGLDIQLQQSCMYAYHDGWRLCCACSQHTHMMLTIPNPSRTRARLHLAPTNAVGLQQCSGILMYADSRRSGSRTSCFNVSACPYSNITSMMERGSR